MRKPTPEELWDAIGEGGAHAERARIDALSAGDVERDLAAAGFDPEAVREGADGLAARLLRRGRPETR
jgi:hypothetical protein